MKKRKKILSLSVIVVTLILAIIVQLWWHNSQNKQNFLQKKLNAVQQENNWYKSLFEAENLWISNNDAEAAIEALNNLRDDEFSDTELIELKIQSIEKTRAVKSQRQSTLGSLESTLSDNQQIIDSLEIRLDSLLVTTKRAMQRSKMREDSLSFSLSSLKSQLNRQDNIQIITFKNAAGNQIHYLGEVSNGKANGGGKGIWNTGSVYTGDWKNNQRHGKGTFEWADGEKYIGDYFEDIRQGKGTYYWTDGRRYEGDWENNKRNGIGTLYDRDGNTEFEGSWANDVPQR